MSEQDLNEYRDKLLKRLDELCKHQSSCQERVEVLRKLKVVERYLFPFWLKEPPPPQQPQQQQQQDKFK